GRKTDVSISINRFSVSFAEERSNTSVKWRSDRWGVRCSNTRGAYKLRFSDSLKTIRHHRWACAGDRSRPPRKRLALNSKLSFLCDTGRRWTSGAITPLRNQRGIRLARAAILYAA